MSRAAWLVLVVLSIGWGTRGVATRAGLEHGLSPITLVSIRLVLAAGVVVVAQLLLSRRIQLTRLMLRTGAIMALTNVAIPFWFFTIAFQYASSGFVGIMAALSPLATALLAHAMLPGETLTPRKFAGLMVGIVGVGVLVASGDSGLSAGGRPVLAALWALPAVIAFSFSTVFAKKEEESLPGLDLLVIQLTIAALVSLVPLLAVKGTLQVDTTGWALLSYLAIASTVIPLFAFYWVLGRSTAGQTALVGYIVPVVAVIAGMVLLGEQIQPGLLVGGATVLAGVVISDRSQPTSPVRTG